MIDESLRTNDGERDGEQKLCNVDDEQVITVKFINRVEGQKVYYRFNMIKCVKIISHALSCLVRGAYDDSQLRAYMSMIVALLQDNSKCISLELEDTAKRKGFIKITLISCHITEFQMIDYVCILIYLLMTDLLLFQYPS